MSSQTKNKDLLFLKRTPTVTYAGGPIPDNIRKYYEQQQLPIRKQSLAANVVNPKKRLVIPRTPMPHSNTLKGNTGFALSVDSLVEEEEEYEDDFNFNDRPPSSIIAVKPKDLTDSEDEEEKVLIISAAPDNNWRNGSIGGKHKYFFFSLFVYKNSTCIFPSFFFYLL